MRIQYVRGSGPTGAHDYSETRYRLLDQIRAFCARHVVTLQESTCVFDYDKEGWSHMTCATTTADDLRVEFI